MIKPELLKRIERQNGRIQPDRHGTCIICKKGWDHCPHTWADIDTLETAYKVYKAGNLG